MTEKRFQYNVNKNSIEYDNKHFAYCNGEQTKIAKKLNELNDENYELKLDSKFKNGAYHKLLDSFTRLKRQNKELKEENNRLIKTTTETIAKQQKKILKLIDKKLEENEELNGVDTAMYYANKGTLHELKKELLE